MADQTLTMDEIPLSLPGVDDQTNSAFRGTGTKDDPVQLPEVVVTAKGGTNSLDELPLTPDPEAALVTGAKSDTPVAPAPQDPKNQYLKDFDPSNGVFQTDKDGKIRVVIPDMGEGDLARYSTNIARFTVGVGLEAVEGLATLGGALSDWAFGTDLEKWAEENIPTVVPKNDFDRFGMKVGSLFLGFGFGAKLTKAGVSAAKGTDTAKAAAQYYDEASRVLGALFEKSPEWAKFGARMVSTPAKKVLPSAKTVEKVAITDIGGTAGATAVMNTKNEDGLIIDRQMLGLEDSEYKQLAGRITVFTDGLAMAGIFNVAADVAKYGYAIVGGLLGPGKNVLMKNGMQDEAMKAILLKLEKITPDSSREEIAAAAREVADLVKNNKESVIKFGDDVLRVLELDTPTAVTKGAMASGDQATANAGMDLKRSMAGEPSTRNTLANQQATIQQAGEDAVQRVGGETSSTAAGREFGAQGSGSAVAAQGTADAAKVTAATAQDAVANAEKLAVDLVEKDPILSTALNNARARYGAPIGGTPQRQVVQGTAGQIGEVYTSMRGKLNELADAIPEGVAVDTASFIDNVKRTLARDGVDVAKDSPVRRALLDAMEPNVTAVPGKTKAGKDTINYVTESEDELIARLEQSLDFKTLYTKIRPALSDQISALMQAGDQASIQAAGKLRALRKHIEEDQVKFVERTGGSDATQAAKGLIDYYKREFAPLFRDQDVLQNFADLADQTVRRGVSQSGFDARAFDLIKGALDSAGPARREQLQTALNQLKNIDPNAIPTELSQYYVGGLLSQLDTMLMGGAKGVEPTAIYSTLSRFADTLKTTNPELVASMNSLVTRLQAAKNDTIQLKAIAADAQKLANQAKNDATTSAFGAFLRQSGDTITGVRLPADVNMAFKDLFNSKNIAEHLPKLFEAARSSGNPLVEEGIYSAYLQWANSSIKTTRTVGADSAGATARELSQMVPVKNLEAFANQDAIVRQALRESGPRGNMIADFMEEIYRQTDMVVGTAGKRSQVRGSTTDYDMALKQSIGRVVTFTLGVLNPVATKARNLGGALASKLGGEEKFKAALDALSADPDLFVKTATRYANAVNRTDRIAVMTDFLVRSNFMAFESPEDGFLKMQEAERIARQLVPGLEEQDLGFQKYR